jgi:peptidyl-prolyl cis-trans isomerase C
MNNVFSRSLATLALLGLLTACNSGGKDSTSADNDASAIATVNGEAITETQLDAYIERRTGNPTSELDPSIREQVINELVNITVLAQQAEKLELDQQSPLKERLEFERSTSLADAAMTRYLEENPVNEEAVREEYESRKGELGGSEYKARHILVDDQATAQELIAELDGGADFATLAKEHSTEPGADQSGGDLGWFQANQMVEPFSAAVQSMEAGNYTSEPVETRFGWHVILLEDSREMEPPAFEQVAQNIERFLTSQRVQAYINELRGKVNVEIRSGDDADAEEEPAAADDETAGETTD